MTRILYIIVCCLMLASCRTTRETINKDLKVEMSQQKDSISEKMLSFDEGSITEIQRNVYDSVIIHITIYRYDTIFVDGSPIIKEKIEVEQVRISGDQSTEQIKDSIKASEVAKADVTYNDTITIQNHEQTQKIQVDERNCVTLLLFLLVVGLAYICINEIKKS